MGFSKTLGIVLVVCYLFSAVVGNKPLKCRGKEIKLSDEDMKGMADCMKQLLPESKDEADPTKAAKSIPKEKMACLGKCIMTKEGLIDDKGMVSKDGMMSKINSTMPEEIIEEMDSALGKCIDENGQNLDPKDETCMVYQPLTQCMHMALIQVCKNKE